MNPGIVFALLSMVFAGINDVVFKKYALKDRSRGVYIFGIGVVWMLLQLLTFALKGDAFVWTGVTVGYGSAAAVFLVISNILLLKSLTHLDVSLGSTIYRLNTVGVIVLSFFILREPFDTNKSMGILCGILAVLLLHQRRADSRRQRQFALFFFLAVLASCFRAFYGVVTRAGIIHAADYQSMMLIIASGWILGGPAYALLREKRFRITGKKLLYCAVSGVLIYFIANFLMLAVTYQPASTVIPLANMSFIVAISLSAIFKLERITLKKGAAISLAVVSILLLSAV